MSDHRQLSFPLPKRLQPQSFENRVESRMCGVVRIIWILTFQSCGNINFMNLVIFDCSWLCGLGIWFEYYHNLNFVLFHLKVKSFDVITFHNPTRHFTWQKKQNIQGCTLCNKFLWVRVQLKCHILCNIHFRILFLTLKKVYPQNTQCKCSVHFIH